MHIRSFIRDLFTNLFIFLQADKQEALTERHTRTKVQILVGTFSQYNTAGTTTLFASD